MDPIQRALGDAAVAVDMGDMKAYQSSMAEWQRLQAIRWERHYRELGQRVAAVVAEMEATTPPGQPESR